VIDSESAQGSRRQSQFPAGDFRTGWGERNNASDKDNTQCWAQNAHSKADEQASSKTIGESGSETCRETLGQVGRTTRTGAV
jgi:hypothetical protein